ncbi:MAG: phosphoenolpyruvate synthase/pyruvate phosphate dikinase, partial [Proteobacteria bacterium]|nr:phosphoenolpyruvate synthase/pyruvate phosphate dikinase [Pseudomonadota bacterium]
MDPKQIKFDSEFYTNSEILYDLTANKIRDILLVSSLYNFFSMEEGGILASRIQNEYKGLHLENPPRITGVSSTEEALLLLKRKEFDMVMIVPNLDNMDVFSLTTKIKAIHSNIPIILLSQNIREIHSLMENNPCEGIDNIFRWTGNPDLLLAIVKNAEDHFNVAHDTRRANLRVLILVEDSPEYYSHLLPIVYKEVVRQTQALLEVGLNEKQRSLTMRARPKILLAKTYEEAIKLYRKYRSFLLCMISDTRLPRDGTMDPEAGIHLLSLIKKENPYISLLLTSSESINRQKANAHAFTFIDKNSSRLAKTIKKYFIEQLGFGDFIFRLPDGQEIDRARNFMTLEEKLKTIPDESIVYHADRNHFSGWVMARCEIALATKFRSVSTSDFGGSDELREFIISNIHALRRYRQKGVVSKFDKYSYDPEVRKFGRIGSGSLGGKARGLAFMDDFFRQYVTLQKKHPEINIMIPRTMV